MQTFKVGDRVKVIRHHSGANFRDQTSDTKVYTRELSPDTVYTIREIDEDEDNEDFSILLDAPNGLTFTCLSWVGPNHLKHLRPLQHRRRHT